MAVAEGSLQPSLSLLARLPVAARQIILLVGLAVAVAVGVASVLWLRAPTYAPLYSGLVDRDVADIASVLDGSGIPYRIDPATGAVMVPAGRKHEVRMEVASAGLPRGSGFGIEEIPEMGSFGQSPFLENALYLHAIETELARTIATLHPVEQARVHLAVPQRSAFLRDRRLPSASVMLKLFPGRRLEPMQTQAVVNLVASSVPELPAERVTVVDQSGELLTAPVGDAASERGNSQFDYRKRLEEDLTRRIETLLAPVVGNERVRASVAADIDFTVAEETRESFDPNRSVVRSEQLNEGARAADTLAQGVPGSLSNQPPEALPEGNPGDLAGAQAAPTTTRSQVRNFEVDKTVSHVRQATGAVRRLSVAVLVDNKPPAAGNGPGEPLAQAELDSLTELVKQAVGFDAARGDTISVLNSAFQDAPAIALPEPPGFLEQPMVWDMGRQALGVALVLILAFVIVRPMVRQLTTPTPALFGGHLPAPQGQNAGQGDVQALPRGYTERIAAARDVASKDPRQVAQLVRTWVAEDNG